MKIRKMKLGWDAPMPPAGSDWDQSTLDETIDTGLLVAGELNGDPAQEHYLAQGVLNDRNSITGFGGIFAYTGNVTEPLIIGIATDSQRQNHPQEPGEWLKAGTIDPSELQPDQFYYIWAEFHEDPVNVSGTVYVIAATNNPGAQNLGWMWGGFSTGVYPKGAVDIFDGSGWNLWAPYDTSFFTWTETGVPPPPVCEDYITQAECENAGCFWYDGSCHTDPQPGDGCEQYLTQAECEANDCYWYPYPPWEPASCHSKQWYEGYLPWIIGGVGGVLIIAALVIKRAPAPVPAYYPPPYPPQRYYPPERHR